MCGGIVINYNKVPKKLLQQYLTDIQIEQMRKLGKITSFFWDKKPFLPVDENGKICLYDWGNRTEEDLPKTGWAKKESIDDGKWQHLKPELVKIPVDGGVEKRVWFDLKGGTQGMRVSKNGKTRVYMITDGADSEFEENTSHSRMPVGKKANFRKAA